MDRLRHISVDELADAAFIAYFANAFIRMILNFVIGSNIYSNTLAMLIPYALVFLAIAANPRKYFKVDFFCFIDLHYTFFLYNLAFPPGVSAVLSKKRVRRLGSCAYPDERALCLPVYPHGG